MTMPTVAATTKATGSATTGYQAIASGISARKADCVAKVAYAPIMIISPCAMLMTPSRP